MRRLQLSRAQGHHILQMLTMALKLLLGAPARDVFALEVGKELGVGDRRCGLGPEQIQELDAFGQEGAVDPGFRQVEHADELVMAQERCTIDGTTVSSSPPLPRSSSLSEVLRTLHVVPSASASIVQPPSCSISRAAALCIATVRTLIRVASRSISLTRMREARSRLA